MYNGHSLFFSPPFCLQISPPLSLSLALSLALCCTHHSPSGPHTHHILRTPHPLHQSERIRQRESRSDRGATSASLTLISLTGREGKKGSEVERGEGSRESWRIRLRNKFLLEGGVRESLVGSSGTLFPLSSFGCVCCLLPSLLLLPPFLLLSALLLTPTLLSQLPPWGLSSLSPSPPPLLPTSPEPCWEPPGCCAAGGCLAGSLHRRPRRLHLRSCRECGEGRWSAKIVRSALSPCPMQKRRLSRTHGRTSTRTARMWGCQYS